VQYAPFSRLCAPCLSRNTGRNAHATGTRITRPLFGQGLVNRRCSDNRDDGSCRLRGGEHLCNVVGECGEVVQTFGDD
jgi:hypothetical protein